jgi:hypothetical protein
MEMPASEDPFELPFERWRTLRSKAMETPALWKAFPGSSPRFSTRPTPVLLTLQRRAGARKTSDTSRQLRQPKRERLLGYPSARIFQGDVTILCH